MNKPFYDRKFPISVNYGAMGSVLGHEFIHGFDMEGKMYDAHGNIVDWWDPVSTAEYNKRAVCLINEYKRETYLGLPVSGNDTLSENIADCGGVKLAYHAYLNAVRDKGHEVDQILPGLKLTGPQQFFVGFSQLWCINAAQSMAANLLNDNHAPFPLRVNVVLRNTLQFAEAFNCPDNSKMKRKDSDRCEIW